MYLQGPRQFAILIKDSSSPSPPIYEIKYYWNQGFLALLNWGHNLVSTEIKDLGIKEYCQGIHLWKT